MKKEYRRQDNRIIFIGIILAAAVIVLCIIGYGSLKNYFSGLSKNKKATGVELSAEMRDELAHTTSEPGSVTPTPDTPENQTSDPANLVTVMPETQHDMTLTPTMDPDEYWAQYTPAPYVPYTEITAHMTSSFQAESSGLPVIPVSYATATSVSYEEDADYSADKAFDGDSKTYWKEGEEGSGTGQRLRVAFDETMKLSYITFRVGNWEDYASWKASPRPQTITVWIVNSGYEVSFSDTMTEFCLAFSREISASEVSFEIDQVFQGSSLDSDKVCISEITFYGSR